MANPVSSRTKNESLDYRFDDDSTASSGATPPATKPAEALACVVEPSPTEQRSSGTDLLVARFSPSPAAASKSVATSAVPVITISGPSTSSGPAPGGGSSHAATLLKVGVGAGAFKTELDVGAVSVKTGTDTDLQATAVRRTVVMSSGGFGVTVTGDAASVRANLGENNDDGSAGGNLGANAELIGAEVTVDTPAGSATFGQSISWGASGSVGVRDKDHDGIPEYCAKFSVPAFTAGVCVEKFW